MSMKVIKLMKSYIKKSIKMGEMRGEVGKKTPKKKRWIITHFYDVTCLILEWLALFTIRFEIAEFFNINLHKEKVLVSERAFRTIGTIANLEYSDILTLYELLHALMLPSGNDAAIALG